MNVTPKKKIVVLGMMSRHPVAGMVFISLQDVIGFHRLGYDAYTGPRSGGSIAVPRSERGASHCSRVIRKAAAGALSRRVLDYRQPLSL